MVELRIRAECDDGSMFDFDLIAQVGTPAGVTSIEHGGILQYVLRRQLSC
jgi:aconitate hydratase